MAKIDPSCPSLAPSTDVSLVQSNIRWRPLVEGTIDRPSCAQQRPMPYRTLDFNGDGSSGHKFLMMCCWKFKIAGRTEVFSNLKTPGLKSNVDCSVSELLLQWRQSEDLRKSRTFCLVHLDLASAYAQRRQQ